MEDRVSRTACSCRARLSLHTTKTGSWPNLMILETLVCPRFFCLFLKFEVKITPLYFLFIDVRFFMPETKSAKKSAKRERERE